MTEFLRTRQTHGEVGKGVDVEAFAFVITAALHHVLVSKNSLPVPDRPTLARYIAEIANSIST